MGRRRQTTPYNIRSGINAIDVDENRVADDAHGFVVANDDVVQDNIEIPVNMAPLASANVAVDASSTQNAPDMNTMFQLLMEQNRMLIQQLAITNSNNEGSKSNSFFVVPDLNKNISSFTGRESGSEAKDWLKTFIGMADINKWPDSLKIESVRANLCGPAQQWFKSRKFDSWVDFER